MDRLLASPHYGERWGRHWLDLARYADSNGYEEDKDRLTAYPYRDFVIRAFNQDLPYDTFVRWQLAGDELDPGNPDALAATGFCTSGPAQLVFPKKKDRYDELDDIVSSVGVTFLGLTLGCARCHDHKYDPIPQREYYRLVAVFTSSSRGERFLDRDAGAAYQRRRQEYEQRLKAARRRLDDWLGPYRRRLREEWLASLKLSAADRALLRLPSDKANRRQQELLKQHRRDLRVTDEHLRATLTAEQQARWAALVGEVKAVEATAPREPARALTLGGSGLKKSFFLKRGDPQRETEEVTPGFLTVLTPGEPDWNGAAWKRWTRQPGGQQEEYPRTALAEWLTDAKSGAARLTARVVVNRLWQHHFGAGLVRTAGDFGTQGERPSHPELLDWLATELIAQGWRLKPLHRLIVTSAAYRQDTTFDPAKARLDPEDRLLWRRRPVRLEAESIRDALLAVSGCLNTRMGGRASSRGSPPRRFSPSNPSTARPGRGTCGTDH